jgi:hypothetical protein
MRLLSLCLLFSSFDNVSSIETRSGMLNTTAPEDRALPGARIDTPAIQ